MQLWLSKNSEVPLREQLVTQIVLGVASGDLRPGQRLPSTRELARRFRIHSNTVSAAYRELAERGWVEMRKGSGIYVRAQMQEALPETAVELDQLIAVFLNLARTRGFTLEEVRERVRHWLELQPPDHFLVIESDAELRAILMAEIEEATGRRAVGVSPDDCERDASLFVGAVPVALLGQGERLQSLIPPDKTPVLLHSRSVPESLKGEEPPPEADALISVVSRWPEFLHWSRVILVAAGIDPCALNFRDARTHGWEKGLRSSSFVITDALTVKRLPAGCHPRVFRIIADDSLKELSRYE
ncbi:MAG: GntR family transcriptional regulator [Pyrinomonadaceae bacterium]|nr:GntR family transcriptional regulator [Pyrinomonadaceae bacterium]